MAARSILYLVDSKKFETQNPPEFIISLFDCFYKEKETYFGHYKIILDPDVQSSSRLEDCEKELYFPIGQELLLKNLNHFFPKMEEAEKKRKKEAKLEKKDGLLGKVGKGIKGG